MTRMAIKTPMERPPGVATAAGEGDSAGTGEAVEEGCEVGLALGVPRGVCFGVGVGAGGGLPVGAAVLGVTSNVVCVTSTPC